MLFFNTIFLYVGTTYQNWHLSLFVSFWRDKKHCEIALIRCTKCTNHGGKQAPTHRLFHRLYEISPQCCTGNAMGICPFVSGATGLQHRALFAEITTMPTASWFVSLHGHYDDGEEVVQDEVDPVVPEPSEVHWSWSRRQLWCVFDWFKLCL